MAERPKEGFGINYKPLFIFGQMKVPPTSKTIVLPVRDGLKQSYPHIKQVQFYLSRNRRTPHNAYTGAWAYPGIRLRPNAWVAGSERGHSLSTNKMLTSSKKQIMMSQ